MGTADSTGYGGGGQNQDHGSCGRKRYGRCRHGSVPGRGSAAPGRAGRMLRHHRNWRHCWRTSPTLDRWIPRLDQPATRRCYELLRARVQPGATARRQRPRSAGRSGSRASARSPWPDAETAPPRQRSARRPSLKTCGTEFIRVVVLHHAPPSGLLPSAPTILVSGVTAESAAISVQCRRACSATDC